MLLQVPSSDHWVGFSGLKLCGPDGWKKRVQVCLPLQAAVNRTAYPEAETDVQGNYCSFGHLVIERLDKPTGTCTPHNGRCNTDTAIILLSFLCLQRVSSRTQISLYQLVATINSVSSTVDSIDCVILNIP